MNMSNLSKQEKQGLEVVTRNLSKISDLRDRKDYFMSTLAGRQTGQEKDRYGTELLRTEHGLVLFGDYDFSYSPPQCTMPELVIRSYQIGEAIWYAPSTLKVGDLAPEGLAVVDYTVQRKSAGATSEAGILLFMMLHPSQLVKYSEHSK